MSKRKNKLINGKFYMAYGGNPHPAFLFKKTKYGTYLAIKTGTTCGKNMIPIASTQEGINISYINNRPFEGTRRDFGDRELLGLSFNPSDNAIIEEVKKRNQGKPEAQKEQSKNKKSRRAVKALRRLHLIKCLY